MINKYFQLTIVALLLSLYANAQEQLGGASDKAQQVFDGMSRTNATAVRSPLFIEIEQADSLLFSAFNAHDTAALMNWFTDDLEFHHDKNGSTDRSGAVAGFASLFKEHPDIQRYAIKKSLEVHPIGTDGALQICQHRFEHIENGSLVNGVSRTIMLWRRTDSGWKVSRVISFGH